VLPHPEHQILVLTSPRGHGWVQLTRHGPLQAPVAWGTRGHPRSPCPGREGSCGTGTFGFADSGVVAAAALVVHAEGVTLALVLRVEATVTAALAGVCKSRESVQDEELGVGSGAGTSTPA